MASASKSFGEWWKEHKVEGLDEFEAFRIWNRGWEASFVDMSAIHSEDVGRLVCEAIGIAPGRVARIILDIDAVNDGPALVYVEMLASPKMLELDWTKLKGTTVNVLDKEDAG
jgi:hypothetical protein